MTKAYNLIELSSGAKYKYVRDIVNDSNGKNTEYYQYEGSGYQELGLKIKHGGMNTGLTAGTIYFFKVNIDGVGLVGYSIVFENNSQNFVDFEEFFQELNFKTLSNGAEWTLNREKGDIRCTSISELVGSSITLLEGDIESSKFTCEADITASLGGKYITFSTPVTDFYGWFDIPLTEKTDVQCEADVARSLSGKYWNLFSGGDIVQYYVWYYLPAKSEITALTFTDDSGSNNDNYGGFYVDLYVGVALHRFWWDVGDTDIAPADGGGTLHEIDIVTSDNDSAVASKTHTIINGVSGLTSDYTTGNSFNVTEDAGGSVTDSSENCSVMSVIITTQGIDETSDPAPGGTGIKITIAEDDVADTVASATQGILNGHIDFSATVLLDTVSIETDDTGVTTDATDGDTGWTAAWTVTRQGQATSLDPTPGGTGIQVTIAEDDTAVTIATALQTAVNLNINFDATQGIVPNNDEVIIINKVSGDSLNATNGNTG